MSPLEHQINLRTSISKKSSGVPDMFSRGKRILSLRVAFSGIVLLALLAIGGWYVLSVENRIDRIEKAKNDAERSLIEEVNALILLPSGETPRIATVVDPSQYANDPLLSQSQVGDKVLVFEKALKAVLYRPSEKKIVDVMGFALPQETRTDL